MRKPLSEHPGFTLIQKIVLFCLAFSLKDLEPSFILFNFSL
jgi:hypothetical protein